MTRGEAEALGFGQAPDMEAAEMSVDDDVQMTLVSEQVPTSQGRDVLFTLRVDRLEVPVELGRLRVTGQVPGGDTWTLNFGVEMDEDGALSQGDLLEVREPAINMIDPEISRSYRIEVYELREGGNVRERTLYGLTWVF